MTKLLIGIHLAEAAIEVQQLPKTEADSLFELQKNELLKKNAVSQNRFNNSYRYYLKNPKFLDIVYAAVIDSLSLREALILEQETR